MKISWKSASALSAVLGVGLAVSMVGGAHARQALLFTDLKSATIDLSALQDNGSASLTLPAGFAVASSKPSAPPEPILEKTPPLAPETDTIVPTRPPAPPKPPELTLDGTALPAAKAFLKATEGAESQSTSSSATKSSPAVRIPFQEGTSELPASAWDSLRSLAARIKSEQSMRLQLLAYAGGKGLSANQARRLSLSRALAVRSYLIEQGIHSTRIDVRALGDKTNETPVNRVDVNSARR